MPQAALQDFGGAPKQTRETRQVVNQGVHARTGAREPDQDAAVPKGGHAQAGAREHDRGAVLPEGGHGLVADGGTAAVGDPRDYGMGGAGGGDVVEPDERKVRQQSGTDPVEGGHEHGGDAGSGKHEDHLTKRDKPARKAFAKGSARRFLPGPVA